MRWRLILLALLTIAMSLGCAASVNAAADLGYRAQRVFVDVQNDPPSQAQQDESNRLSQESLGLQLLVMPLAFGSLAGALAITLVLARRWQLREDAPTSASAA